MTREEAIKDIQDNILPVVGGKSLAMAISALRQPDIICCKDCIYQTESWSGIKYCEAHGDHIGKDYDYCSNARRKENGQTDFTASCD